MENPKIATDQKPAPKVKTELPVAAVLTETTKPKKPDSTPKSSNKPKTVAPTPVPEAKVKAGQPVVSMTAEAKPEKASLAKKPAKNTQIEASKPVPKAKTEQPISSIIKEATPKIPKTVAPKPAPKANIEQPVLSAEGANPKKATASQRSPKKPKVASPKAVVPVSETATPERASLPPGNIWPNWVVNLLVSFGIKKK